SLHLRYEWSKDSFPNRMRKLLDNVLPTRNELRALPDQGMRAEALSGSDVSGHRENFTIRLEAEAHRDQRTRIFGRFDHGDPKGHPRNNSITDRKVLRRRRCAKRKLRHNRAIFDH